MLRLRARDRGSGLGLALIVAVAILVISACNGGDGGGGSDQAQSMETAEANQTATPTTPTATSGETPFPTLPPDAGALEQLAAKFIKGVDGKVSYRYISNFGLHPDGVWTVYRLSDDYRQDWQLSDVAATNTVIIASTGVYVCTQTPFITSCFPMTEEDANAYVIIFTPINEVPQAIVEGMPGLESTELPDETIAGVEGNCFQLMAPGRIGVGPEGTEEIKICFSADGLLLLMERTVLFEDPSFTPADLSLAAQEVGAAATADFEPLEPEE